MSEIKIRDASFAQTYADIHCACFAKGWNEAMMRQMLLLPGSLGLIAYQHDNRPVSSFMLTVPDRRIS